MSSTSSDIHWVEGLDGEPREGWQGLMRHEGCNPKLVMKIETQDRVGPGKVQEQWGLCWGRGEHTTRVNFQVLDARCKPTG